MIDLDGLSPPVRAMVEELRDQVAQMSERAQMRAGMAGALRAQLAEANKTIAERDARIAELEPKKKGKTHG